MASQISKASHPLPFPLPLRSLAMVFYHPIEKDIQLSGKTLVIPVVSTANVSQLAVDLLIASFSLKRVAVFDPSYFVPAVGGREDGGAGVTTPLELYGDATKNLLCIQQRSPVLRARKQEFVDTLLHFITSSGVGSVLILSGLDASNRTDSQMLSPVYHILPPKSLPLQDTPLRHLIELPIPPYRSTVSHQTEKDNPDTLPFIPGGGITRRILSSIPNDWSVPVAVLVQYALEGDNRADAQLMAAVVAQVLGLDRVTWKQPSSWNHGLFGALPDQNLYG